MSSRALALLLLVACGGPVHHPLAAPPPEPRGPAAPAIAVQAGDLAITHVTVVAMATPGELADQTVVVRGDRIVGLGPSAQVALVPGVQTIDGTGRWLMPGLTDMHVHMFAEDDLTLFLAAGVTTVRNMFGSENHLAWRSEIAKGTRVGPTIVTAGPIIDGDPPVWPGSAVLTDPAAADALVAAQKAAGYDFLKPYAKLSRPAYEALVIAGAKYGMPLEGHVPSAVGLVGVLNARQKTVEHLDGWINALVRDGVTLPDDGNSIHKLRAALAAQDDSKLAGLIARTVAAGTWNCPTLVVHDRIGALDDVAALQHRVAWLAFEPAMMIQLWNPKQDFRLKAMTADDYAVTREANVVRQKLVARLAREAPLLVGTDTGNPYVVAGAALHDEIELLIQAGIPRPRVLQMATADAARFLGTPHEFSVVEAGARADLVLVASDPLAQPLPQVPDGVMVRGKWLPRAEIQAKLDELAQKNAAPPAAKDRWQGVPPIAAKGKVSHEARYDVQAGAMTLGEERLVVVLDHGKRTVSSQVVFDVGGRVDVAYALAPDAAELTATSALGKVALAGKVAGGKLVVTGTDAKGQPIAISEPLPAGAFLEGPGVGGAILIAEQVSALKVGGKRTLASVGLRSFPTVGVESTSYTVERTPDAGGNRVFAVVATAGKQTTTGALVVDAKGYVVSYTTGGQMSFTFTRRPS